MKFFIKYFFVVFTITSFISCDRCKDCVLDLTFRNDSQRTLHLMYSIKYPDTSLIYRKNCCNDCILPLSKANCVNRLGWNYSNNSDILLFFLWDKDTIDKYGFDNCNDRILKKYKYSVSELENMGWTITYP